MRILLLISLQLTLMAVYGQSGNKIQEVDIIDHQVKLGESVRLLSKKYLVDPSKIYELNRFAVDGISEGMILKIPVPRKPNTSAGELTDNRKKIPKSERESSVSEHSEVVQNQENKGKSIQNQDSKIEPRQTQERKEEVTDAPVTKTSGDIKQIVITEDKTEINHKVLPKETLYSLAREYNVTVDEIKANNPQVAASGLQVGQVVRILASKKVEIKQSTSIIKPVPNGSSKPQKTVSQSPNINPNIIKHQVQPKETLYSLSKKYNVSVEQIKAQNATLLINGLQIGQVLEINPGN